MVGLTLAKDMGAQRLKCKTDSQLVVGQVQGRYQVKDDLSLEYYEKVTQLVKEFEEATLEHIPRANKQTCCLS